MALVTASDYKTALQKILYVIKHCTGLSKEDIVRKSGITRANINQVFTELGQYEQTRASRIHG